MTVDVGDIYKQPFWESRLITVFEDLIGAYAYSLMVQWLSSVTL